MTSPEAQRGQPVESEPATQPEPQATDQPAITRATLEDRWAGLMLDRRQPTNPSPLQARMDALLSELFIGVARVDPYAYEEDAPGWSLQQVHEDLRESILRNVEASGMAQ